MASVHVRFSPGFPLGFTAEQFLLQQYLICSAGNKMSKTTADQHPRCALRE
jgi:hypothetical protein